MPIVEVKRIRKRFGATEVLRDLSFDVAAGSVVGLIGRSGSGKSTLLRCINGLEAIDGGEIRVDGITLDPGRANLRALRREIGIVFQAYNLFPHLTVERNITLGPTVVKKLARAEARDIARDVLAKVGLSEKLSAYPDQLSGGQQQRVAIARALAMAPKVMLFDEVTSALDPELTEEVLRVMAHLARDGMTMLVVTHEMAFARSIASEIIFMRQGCIHESGSPAELFARPRTPELRQFIAPAFDPAAL